MTNNDNKQKSTLFLLSELLGNILSYASNPGQCGDYITTQVRELVGAKIVALLHAPLIKTDSDYRIVSVCPQRYTETVSRREILDLAELSAESTSLVRLNPADQMDNGARIIASLGFADSYILPLKAGGEHVGALLLLDLLSTDGIGTVTDALQSLAEVIGLIFRNSMLYQNLDLLVEERTIALEKEVQERKKAEQEQRKLEEQLRQAHKMEAIGTLAGGIAHDFNNLLAVILGYAEMAMDDIPAGNQARYHIGQVITAGNRAKSLVKQILSFSRKEPRALVPVAIENIVKEALKLLRSSIPTTIEIRQNIGSGCGSILADSVQVHQVLMNLCTNAAQAMEEHGGILQIDLTCVELDSHHLIDKPDLKPGRYVMLTVKDNGTGIDEKVIDRIFDPYFTTKEIGKGSGMGLSVVLGIVKSHLGAITVSSTLGKGTAFHVYFPKIDTALTTRIEESTSPLCGRERILVVDDDFHIANLTKRRVERLGYQATMETNSKAALELFRSQPDSFDLIISDQTMPHMTGEQLAGQILAIRPDMPIILCSGYSEKMDEEKAKALGIGAFIMKPVDLGSLAHIIRQILDDRNTAGK